MTAGVCSEQNVAKFTANVERLAERKRNDEPAVHAEDDLQSLEALWNGNDAA